VIEQEEGIFLLVDKPIGWTSFDVVNKLRYILRKKRIGHAGTLDPLATGLLIVCAGKMTKQIDEFQGLEKEYTGKFTLGQTTPSYDLETEPGRAISTSHLTRDGVIEATRSFIGKIQQIPPAHSSIKVDGKRAYSYARKGKEVILKPREIEVKEFQIVDFQNPVVSFKVVCSKGTYIRSLAHDFGTRLGVGAYLSELRRTRIGTFNVNDAETIDAVRARFLNINNARPLNNPEK
jgi:tRNA pseudouridine55 synthase